MILLCSTTTTAQITITPRPLNSVEAVVDFQITFTNFPVDLPNGNFTITIAHYGTDLTQQLTPGDLNNWVPQWSLATWARVAVHHNVPALSFNRTQAIVDDVDVTGSRFNFGTSPQWVILNRYYLILFWWSRWNCYNTTYTLCCGEYCGGTNHQNNPIWSLHLSTWCCSCVAQWLCNFCQYAMSNQQYHQ